MWFLYAAKPSISEMRIRRMVESILCKRGGWAVATIFQVRYASGCFVSLSMALEVFVAQTTGASEIWGASQRD